MRAHRVLALLAVFFAAASCRSTGGLSGPSGPGEPGNAKTEAAKPIRLTLAATNDLHGWIQPHTTRLAGGAELSMGGLANLSGYVKLLRENNPGGVILLDAGDSFQGTMAANLSEGQIVVELFNLLGYRAAAIGNHEFDYGPEGPISVVKEGMDPFGALKARMKQARYPILAANVYEAATGARPSWLSNEGVATFEVQGVKIGVVGLVTPSTPTVTNPVNVSTLRFASLVPEAQNAAQRLRERGAEVVIGLVHAGGKCSSIADPRDLSSCDLTGGEIFELLNSLPAHTFDAMIAGHVHSTIGHFVNGTPVVESFGLGRYLSTIELYFDPKARQIIEGKTEIRAGIPVCGNVEATTGSCEAAKLAGIKSPQLLKASFLGKAVVPDPVVEALIAPALARVAEVQKKPLGLHVPSPLGRHYEQESALGSFLADSLKEMEGADAALLNSGGLRADVRNGELTYGDVYEVIPFDNTVANLTMTGEELERLLRAAYGSKKGVFQVAGLKVKLSRCPGRDRLREVSLIDGRPLKADRRYKLAVPDFLARGGDGLGPVLSTLPAGRIDLGERRELNFRDAMVDFWQKSKKPFVAPKPGRIVFLDDGASCTDAAKLDGHNGSP